ncbi:sulfatase-like hydrolase/transferase [Candidatus Hydrogenedentota bacterium]
MPQRPMNVLFIMTDQQRADSIGPDRHPCADYPHMEHLASESASFDHFYTAASPCVPSRISFLTGRNPWTANVWSNMRFMTGSERTWMSMLRNHGYRCVSVGKTHMVHAGSFHLQTRTGDSYGEYQPWDHFHPAASPAKEEDYFDVLATEQTCESLRMLKAREKPFAIFLGFHAPHEPYTMPEKYLDYVKPEEAPLPKARCKDELKTKSQGVRKRVEMLTGKFGDITQDDMVRKAVAGYHCILKMIDDCLGKVLGELKKLDLLDNTLIIYTSDHGEMLGDHWMFNKAAGFYEQEVRIPFMMRFPDGSHAGKRIDGLASSVDYVPTLFDVLGIEEDVSLPGKSLMPMIEDGEELRDAVTCATRAGFMLRTKTHKLWCNAEANDGEMYDLIADPDELDNLYDKPEHKQLRGELYEKMLHVRMDEDMVDNDGLKIDALIHDEASVCYEPEISGLEFGRSSFRKGL